MFNRIFARKRKSIHTKRSFRPTLESLELRQLFAGDTAASPTKAGVVTAVAPVVAEVSENSGLAPSIFAKARDEQHAPDTLSGEAAMRVLERVYGKDPDGNIRYPEEFDPRVPGLSGNPKFVRNSQGEKIPVIDVNTVVITIDPAALGQTAGPVRVNPVQPQTPAGQVPYTDEHRLRMERLRGDIHNLDVQSIGREQTVQVVGPNGPVPVTRPKAPGTRDNAAGLHDESVAFEQRLNALIAQARTGSINEEQLQALRDDVTRSQMAADKRTDPRDYQDPEEETRRLDAEARREVENIFRPQVTPTREVRGVSHQYETMTEIVEVRPRTPNVSNDPIATAEREIPAVAPLDAIYTNENPIDGATPATLSAYNSAVRAADAASTRYQSLVQQYEKARDQLQAKQAVAMRQFYDNLYASRDRNPNWSWELQRFQEQQAEEMRRLGESWGGPIVAANQEASDTASRAGRLWGQARDEESAVVSQHEKARNERVAAVSRRISELMTAAGDTVLASFFVPVSTTPQPETVGGNRLVVRHATSTATGTTITEQIVETERQLPALQQAEIEKRDAAYFEMERLRWSGRTVDKDGNSTPEYEAVLQRYTESNQRLSELTSATLVDRDGEVARAQAAEENRLNAAMEALRSQGYEVTRTATGYEARMKDNAADTSPRQLPTITLPGHVPMSELDTAVAAIAMPLQLCPSHVDTVLADTGTLTADPDFVSDAQPNSPLQTTTARLTDLYRELARQQAILGDYRRGMEESQRRIADLNAGMNAQFQADHSSGGIGLSAQDLYARMRPNRAYPNYYTQGQPRHLDGMVANGDPEVPADYIYRQHQVARDEYTAREAMWPQAVREQEQRIQQIQNEIYRLTGNNPGVNGNTDTSGNGSNSNGSQPRPTPTSTGRVDGRLPEAGNPPAQDLPAGANGTATPLLDHMRAVLEQRTREYSERYREWRGQRTPIEIAANRVDALEGSGRTQELLAAQRVLDEQMRRAVSQGFDPEWAARAGRELSNLQDEVRRQERMLADHTPVAHNDNTAAPGHRSTYIGPSTNGGESESHLPSRPSRPVRRATRK